MAIAKSDRMLELNNGVQMPSLGLGVFQSPPAETVGAVEAALAAGYRLIDTAAAYGNEREVGEAIRRSGIDRAEIFVTSKLWISDYGYEPALRGSAGSLRRLGVDYMDLYLLHQPMPNDFEATVGAYTALEKVLADGQARAIGVCNHKPEHLENLIGRTDVVPAVNQVEVHPVLQPARVTSGPRSLRDRHPGLVTDRRRVRVPACRPERAEEPARGPDDRRPRNEIRQDPRPSHPPLAYPARALCHPEVGPCEPERREFRRLRLRADHG